MKHVNKWNRKRIKEVFKRFLGLSDKIAQEHKRAELLCISSVECTVCWVKLIIFFNHIHYDSFKKQTKTEKCVKGNGFKSHHYVLSKYQLWNFWPPVHLPPHSSTSTRRYLGTTPPLGCFLLLTRSRHARSTKIRISAFQKTPRQRHLKSKEERWSSKRRKRRSSRL